MAEKKKTRFFLDPGKWEKISSVLKPHFDNQAVICLLNENDPDQKIYIPVKKRGNNVYQKELLRVFNYIEETFNRLIEIKEINSVLKKSNAFMVSLTIEHKIDVETAWKKAQSFLSEYFSEIKRDLKKEGCSVVFAWAVYEAHEDGFPHVHCVVVLDKMVDIKIRKRRNGGEYGFIDDPAYIVLKRENYDKTQLPLIDVSLFKKGKEYYTDVNWKKLEQKEKKSKETVKLKRIKPKNWDYGFIDCSGVYSKKKALAYLSKYLVKGFRDLQYTFYRLERKFNEGKQVSISDYKKILAIYHFLINKYMKSYRLYGQRDLINFRKTLYKKTYFDFTQNENLFRELCEFQKTGIESDAVKAFFDSRPDSKMLKKNLARFLADNQPYDYDENGKKVIIEREKWVVEMKDCLSARDEYYQIPVMYNLFALVSQDRRLREKVFDLTVKSSDVWKWDMDELDMKCVLGKIEKIICSPEKIRLDFGYRKRKAA